MVVSMRFAKDGTCFHAFVIGWFLWPAEERRVGRMGLRGGGERTQVTRQAKKNKNAHRKYTIAALLRFGAVAVPFDPAGGRRPAMP
jgi:hypothetical protein